MLIQGQTSIMNGLRVWVCSLEATQPTVLSRRHTAGCDEECLHRDDSA